MNSQRWQGNIENGPAFLNKILVGLKNKVKNCKKGLPRNLKDDFNQKICILGYF